MSLLAALTVTNSRTGTSLLGTTPSWIFAFYLIVLPLTFHFLSSHIVAFQRPELAVLNAHSKVVACTDTPEFLLLPTDTPLPLCTDPIETGAISCAYAGSGVYAAPQSPTRAQATLCPKLISGTATGSTSPIKSAPTYPFDEMTLRVTTTFWFTTGLLVVYILFAYIRDKIRLAQ